MKRSKDEEKDDAVVNTPPVVNNNNNSKVSNNNNASPPNSNNNTVDANNVNVNGSGTSAMGTVRTTGRVKKPKQVYDPSDNYISRGSRNSLPASSPVVVTSTTPTTSAVAASPLAAPTPASSPVAAAVQQSSAEDVQPTEELASTSMNNNSSGKEDSMEIKEPNAELQRKFDICMKCNKSEPRRGPGYKSNYIGCKSCSQKWHFNCLPIEFEARVNARKRYKCEKCRRCRICASNKKVEDNKLLIVCCICVNVYHLECHNPRVSPLKLTDHSWKCYTCDPTYNPLMKKKNNNDNGAEIEFESPPRTSKVGRKKRATSNPADSIAAKIPKMSNDKEQPTNNGKDNKEDKNLVDLPNSERDIIMHNEEENKSKSPKIKSESPETENEVSHVSELPKSSPKSFEAPKSPKALKSPKTLKSPEDPKSPKASTSFEASNSAEAPNFSDATKSPKPSTSSENPNSSEAPNTLKAPKNSSEALNSCPDLPNSPKSAQALNILPPEEGPSTSRTPRVPLTINIEDNAQKDNENVVNRNVNEFIENVRSWSYSQVYDYIFRFCPEEAPIFRVQQIDGVALLELRREDVIDRFGLKLGKALRLYEVVLGLQDPTQDFVGWMD